MLSPECSTGEGSQPRPVSRPLVAIAASLGLIAFTTTAVAAPIEGDAADTKVLIAERPTLPPTVRALDEAQREELRGWVAAAERFRGLSLRTPLAAGVQGQDAARATLARMLAEELPPEEAETAERILELLGLWPADRGLVAVMLEVLSSEVAGYYDPARDYLALVEGVGDEIDSELAPFGEALSDRMAGAVWVHEVGHALQDQHFDLEALGIGDDALLSDRSLALGALVEGDATLVMFSYVMGTDLERLPMARSMVEGFTADPADLASLVAGQGDTNALLQAPAYLQESLVFPYLQGLAFCLAVREAGGQKLLDYLFEHDPPASTEQILHPEKWLAMRDEPVVIALPDLTPWLAGRAFLAGGDLGELTIRIMLTERLGGGTEAGIDDGSRERARAAAAGWGGDAIAFYGAGDGQPGAAGEVLVWVSEWDDQEQADEFLEVARDAFDTDADTGSDGAGNSNWQLAYRDTRVILAHGLAKDEGAPLVEHLLAMPVTRTAPVRVDLAALGIGDDDKAGTLDGTGLAEMLADPVMQSLLADQLGEGAEDLIAMFMQDPELLTMAMELGMAMMNGEEEEGVETLLESLDLEAIQSSPAVQELGRKLLSKQEKVLATFEGGTVHVETLGFSMPLGIEDSWLRFDDNEAVSAPAPDAVPIVFQAGEAQSDASVTVLAVALPFQVPLESVVAGVKSEDLGRSETLRSGYLETDGVRGWEREIVMRQPEGRTHTIQRLYLVDRHLITIIVGGPASRWKRIRSKILPALDGIAFD